MKRRENYHDVKDGDGRLLSSKSSRDKDDIKHKDDKYMEKSGQISKSRDVKHRAESEKDNKHREDGNRYKNERYREDVDHDHRYKNQRPRDDKDREKRARDPDHRDAKKLKYGSDYDRQTNKRGGSPVCDDRVSRHKDNKDRKRDNKNNNNKDEVTDYRSREAEKISLSDAKMNLVSERGRSSSRDDMEITSHHMHHRSSSSAKLHRSRDHHRVLKQEETKYRDHVREDRARQDFAPGESDKISSRSLEKTTQKAENRANDLSAKKRLKSDSRSSPSSTSKFSSFLPPQSPFKTVLDSPLNICNRGLSDPNMGRAQTSWNNWASSPLANSGYTPFHNVPSSLYNPVMQQFPMFGGLPMNMNHAGFFGHGLHGWGSTSGGFGNWDHGRTRFNNQIWNGQGSGVKIDMKSVAEKNDDLVHGPIDEIWTEQIGPHIDKEQIQPDFKTPEVMKVKQSFPVSMVKKDDDNFICAAYLSRIDISEDLTGSKLYEQCQRMLGLDQASAADESDCRILYLEAGVDADSSNGGSLFAAADDSVFKKAMSLYTKQKVHFSAANKGIVSVSDQDQEKSCPVDVKLVEKSFEGPVLAVSQEHYDPPVGNLDMNNMNEEDMEMDHAVESQEKEGRVPSVGGCEVKELDKQIVGGSFSVLNSELPTKLSEFGLVNLHRHSPESTH